MKGFKSFADNVSLELEPGVTVVVGPNGSGKSNVVDAIAWVLGAQAPSSVRSQKMDDVIFAGTANRAALGRAEVSLVIDNTSGMLPTEFNELQITRTLFRSGDSEYSMNGVPCRLLDIQEMLSDSGVGRTQHVIISQGQIDAVLNARPEERRLIIEEAAGVLKYRKRREKAQRRLVATEANLTRIQDLLREIRRQLRPLEKQADAARRHGDVVAELRACQLWLAGREVESHRATLDQAARDRRDLSARDRELRSLLARLDADIVSLESDLSAQGAVDLGDALARLERLDQRSQGAAQLLDERMAGLARERQATIDGDVLAALRAEIVELGDGLAAVDGEIQTTVPVGEEISRSEQSLAEDRQTLEGALAVMSGEGAEVAAAGRAAEVRGELAALRTSIERAGAEVSAIDEKSAALDARRTELETRAGAQRASLDDAVQQEATLVEAADRAAAAHDAAKTEAKRLQADLSEANAVWRSSVARRDALAEALAGARAAAGAEDLEGLPGMVGSVLDVISVDPGWEDAVEAALGDALSALVVESADAARTALERFANGPGHGAVMPLSVGSASEGSPNSILQKVSGTRTGADSMLASLLADIDVVGGDWRAAIDHSLATGRVTVTQSGDRVGGGVWRLGSAGVGATKAALDDASSQVEAAEAVRAALAEATTRQDAELASARDLDRETAAALDGNDAELTSTTEALHQIDAKTRQIDVELDAISSQRSELAQRLDRESSRIGELEGLLPGLESAEAASAERSRELEDARNTLTERTRTLAGQRREHEVKVAALEERRGVLRRRLGEVQNRLERLEVEESEAEEKRQRIDRAEALSARVQRLLGATRARLSVHLEARRAERQAQSERVRELSERLATLRSERSAGEDELRELAERQSRLEIDEAEARLRLENTTEMLRRDLDIDPAGAVEAPRPELPDGVKPAARARELERDLRIMGPINPLALQEFDALQERHELVKEQLDDIRSSRKELNKVIKAIDEEIVTVFASAYADVADNFTMLFERLFPGGKGSLKLTEPDNLLDTGIEVSAKPSGKNVKKLSLLSGGERSLTALAFLFAVFRSRPSPFYVMDEVEAALDDVNLHRFLSLVEEFRTEAQLVIVSHQKRTMEAADSLYGVTMEPGGSSKVLSERSEVERRFGAGPRREEVMATIDGS